MTNTNTGQLIEQASARLGEPTSLNPLGVQLYRDTDSVVVQTAIGQVECFVITTDKHNAKARHVRATFYLNGKRIARAKLDALLVQGTHEFYPGGFNGQCTYCDGYEGIGNSTCRPRS